STTAETAPGDHPPANSRVSALADTFLHPLGFWPAQRGEKSPLLNASARARRGAMADAASGNAGATLLIGPSARMMRFTIPRAGRPENRLVIAVTSAASLVKAARCTVLVAASGHSRYEVPTWTPAAPRDIAAATPRASAIPPAAMTGMRTARTT